MQHPPIIALVSDRVYIFDTTLRDGEQSPGCSMTVPEKLAMARKVVDLGVDILEAGFPIASEGDFEAVDAARTKVTIRMLGFTESPASQRMRQFFVDGNQRTLDGLAKAAAEMSRAIR